MYRRARTARLWIAVFACTFSVCAPAFAATAAPAAPATPSNNVGQALEIAPPVITLSGDPGQTIKTQISLRDISSGNLLVSGQVNDFVAAGEDGTPKILLDEKEVDPYSIKGWITPVAPFIMIPREIKNLPVTIVIPANASPGGHYGVVRFTGTPPELKGTGVSLSASLGALLLITVSGNVKEQMSVQSLSVSHNGKTGTLLEGTPLEFTERIKNSGNIHELPTGQVVITDMFGKTVGAVNVNVPPRNILPQSIRKFSQPLDSTVIGNKKLFGRYHADLKLTYGKNAQTVTSRLDFWVIPYRLIGTAIVALVGGFFVLRFVLRRYNQTVINKASKSKNRRR
jgi:hypothetical protein